MDDKMITLVTSMRRDMKTIQLGRFIDFLQGLE